jgi:AraC-like DNA-binding protein
MQYERMVPSGPLAAVVRQFWSLRADDVSRIQSPEHVLPDGGMQILFRTGAPICCADTPHPEWLPRAVLVGPTTRAVRFRATGGAELFGAHLHPGAAAVLGLYVEPAWVDARLPLDRPGFSITNGAADRVFDFDSAAGRMRALSAMMESWMRAGSGSRVRARRSKRVARRMECAVRCDRVDEFAARLGLGARQVDRIFLRHVGVAPKLYFRLRRFRRAVAMIARSARPVNGSSLAAAVGYSDQSHLIRDFKRFAGTTPSALARGLSDLSRAMA